MADTGNFLERMNPFTRGPKKELGPTGFTYENASERFRLLSAAGSEGQQPKATFKSGTTLILTQYKPGTIVREKWEVDEESGSSKEYYWFWCIGSKTKQGNLAVFDSTNVVHPEDPIYRQTWTGEHPDAIVAQREIGPNRPNNEVSFTVGGPVGMLLDRCLETMSPGEYPDAAARRRTIQFDILEMGKPVKEGVTKAIPTNAELNPQLQPSAG